MRIRSTRRRLAPLAAIAFSFALIASFWLTWILAFDMPIRGWDIARILARMVGKSSARIPVTIHIAPYSVLLLGLLGSIWSYLVLAGSPMAAKVTVGIMSFLLSCALFASATYLVNTMVFPSDLGFGFWLAYVSSAVLMCIIALSALGGLKPHLKTPIDYLLFAFVRAVSLIFRLLPLRIAIGVGRELASLILALLPKRKRVAMRNLDLVFGNDMSSEDRAKITSESFRNMGRMAAELSHLEQLIKRPTDELFTYENLKAVEKATAGGKGLIILTGHFGCWELSQLAMTKAGFPMTALARPLDNTFLDRWVNRMRAMAGSTIIARRHSVRRIVSELRAGKIVAVLFDQNVHRKECVFAKLAGMNVSSSPLPAALHRMTGAEVIFGAGIPCSDGRHKLVLSDPIPTIDSDDNEEFITANTSAYNAVFEQTLRNYPEAWLWVHNRFKDKQDSPGFWAKRKKKRS